MNTHKHTHSHVITAMHLLLSLVHIAKVAVLLLFASCKSSFCLSCTHSAQISRSCRVFCSCQARIMHFAVFCIECQPSLAVKNIPTCATDKQLSRESHYSPFYRLEKSGKAGSAAGAGCCRPVVDNLALPISGRSCWFLI